jgi:exonuclease V gamma subunit
MGRWLSLQLAKQGICARRSVPAEILVRNFQVAAETPEVSFSIADDDMALMRVLLQMAGRAGFEDLRNHINGERPEFKRFQPAEKISDVFNQYIAFRPQMI